MLLIRPLCCSLSCMKKALSLVQEQKFAKAKLSLERVLPGPSTELADRARVHLRGVEQRLSSVPAPTPKTADEHYTQGVAMMNLGRWDEAREHLDRARRSRRKRTTLFMPWRRWIALPARRNRRWNLEVAIQLRPENRYHARNDEDFAFLQEDPRFTELLYPEREGSAGSSSK